jgi:hypothetical protein
MHLYGLTDLYGGSSSPTFSSLMAGQNHRLLAYEKWILGWLADSQITCLDGTDNGTIKKQVTEIKFNNDASEQVVVISQSNVRDAIIIEKANIFNQVTQGVDSYLAFYSLKNDERPPIFMYPIAGVGQNFMTHYNGVASTRYISNVVKSDDYQLLISNVDQLGVTLHLVPKSESDKLTALQASARNIQAEAEAKVLADIQAKEKAAADAEAKAKADAEAKAKAKSRVQSSTKIAVKPKTITCVKGKVSKKITASKPKCPAGFKQR